MTILSITRTVRKSCLAKQLIYCRWFSQFPWNSFLRVSLQPFYSLQNLLPHRLLVTWATLAFLLVVITPQSHAHGDCTLDELKEKARSACDHLSEKLGNDTRDPFHKGRDSLGYHLSHGKFSWRYVSHSNAFWRLERPIVDETTSSIDRMLLPCEYFRKCKISAVWTSIKTTSYRQTLASITHLHNG